MAEKKKPEFKFRAGGVTATAWKNIKKIDGKDIENFSVSVTRSYKDGDDWKTTDSFNLNDLPKLEAVAKEAYKKLVLKEE